MKLRVTYHRLGDQLKKLAALSKKELHVVNLEQGLLFSKDGQKFTPPFGGAPIKESLESQLEIGRQAVARQMGALFQSQQSLDILRNPKSVGHAILGAIRGGDLLTAEALLTKVGIRTLGVIEKPTKDLHRQHRTNWGRVRTNRPYIVRDNLQLGAQVREAQMMVGTGKAGWNPAIRGIGGKLKASLNRRIGGASVPRQLKGLRESGRFVEGGSGDKSFVEVRNEVPYLQKHSAHIMSRAWQNRLRNLPKQIATMEREIEKSLNAARL